MPRRRATQPFNPRRYRAKMTLRRLIFLTAGVALLAGLALLDRQGLFGRAHGNDLDTYDGRQFTVVKVVDGDTLDIDCPDNGYSHTRIRLLGVDTPETVKPNTPVQYFGPEAAKFTTATALGKTVTVRLDPVRTRDSMKTPRLLAYVQLPDGADLSERIISTGHGYADPRFNHPRKKAMLAAQKNAIAEQAGLWKDVREGQLPDYYQKQEKYRSMIRLPSSQSR